MHDVLSQRKVRTWQKSYETIMIRYIDLCVELKVKTQSITKFCGLVSLLCSFFLISNVSRETYRHHHSPNHQDHNRGKDGLHQYRNLSQTQAPGSLEVMIDWFGGEKGRRDKEKGGGWARVYSD